MIFYATKHGLFVSRFLSAKVNFSTLNNRLAIVLNLDNITNFLLLHNFEHGGVTDDGYEGSSRRSQ